MTARTHPQRTSEMLIAFLLGLLPFGVGFSLLLAFSRVREFLFAYRWHGVLLSGI